MHSEEATVPSLHGEWEALPQARRCPLRGSCVLGRRPPPPFMGWRNLAGACSRATVTKSQTGWQQKVLLSQFRAPGAGNQVPAPYEGCRRDATPRVRSSFWWRLAVLGVPWLIEAALQSPPCHLMAFFAGRVLCPDPLLLIRRPVTGFKSPSLSDGTLYSLDQTCKDPLPKQGHIHRSHVFVGVTSQPATQAVCLREQAGP